MGTSSGQTEPVMGHPVFPPPVAFTQPTEGLSRQKLGRKFQLDSGSCCSCCGRCEDLCVPCATGSCCSCCGRCEDFCVPCCCALCQEHRELQSRGLDPSLGGEVAQQTSSRPTDVPTPPGVMLR